MEKMISLDRFSLEKVKLVKDGGLDVHWEHTDIQGALTYIDQEHKTSSKEPHPDLVVKINTLKPFLAKMWGYDIVKTLSEAEKFGADIKQKEELLRTYNELLSNIEITGISVKGKAEKMAVVITGKRRMYENIFQPMHSGRLQLSQKIYGFENDLEDLVPQIKEEVYEYLFKGKCQNPTLFGDNEQIGTAKKELPKEEKKTKRKKGEAQAQEPDLK